MNWISRFTHTKNQWYSFILKKHIKYILKNILYFQSDVQETSTQMESMKPEVHSIEDQLNFIEDSEYYRFNGEFQVRHKKVKVTILIFF